MNNHFDFYDIKRIGKDTFTRNQAFIISLSIAFILSLIVGIVVNKSLILSWCIFPDVAVIKTVFLTGRFFEVFISLFLMQLSIMTILFLLSLHKYLIVLYFIVAILRGLLAGALIVTLINLSLIIGIVFTITAVLALIVLSLSIILICSMVVINCNDCCYFFADRIKYLLKCYFFVLSFAAICVLVLTIIIFIVCRPLIALI